MKTRDKTFERLATFIAWANVNIDYSKAKYDFEQLLLAIEQCRDHFHKEELPAVIEETIDIAESFIEGCKRCSTNIVEFKVK